MSKQREYSNERRRRRSLTQPEAEVDPTIAKLSRLFNRENSIRESFNRKSQKASKRGKEAKTGERSRPSSEEPRAISTVGLPGSGKSTIARHMVSRGNTDQHEFDKSRKELGKGPAYFGPDLPAHTFGGAKKSAEKGRNTALTNTSIPRAHRKSAEKELRDAGYSNVKSVLAPGSTKAAMRRNRKRKGSTPGESQVPQSVMNRMARGMKSLSKAERRELRTNYKELHRRERFTKPAMKRSGAIREENIKSFLEFLEEAREATRATTRGRRLDPGRTQREVAREDRKREARERAAERKERAADAVISQLQKQGKEEREAAAARANPEAQRKKALRRTLAQRMAAAAEKQGIND